MAQASLRVPAELGRLAEVRRFVRERLAAAAVEEPCVSDLVQAVDETVTNVIRHGYRGAPGSVELEIHTGESDVTVRVRDACPPFDPTRAPTPDTDAPLARRPLGGMGIHLTRVLTSGMVHRILPGGGNELTLVKRRAVTGGTPGDADPD